MVRAVLRAGPQGCISGSFHPRHFQLTLTGSRPTAQLTLRRSQMGSGRKTGCQWQPCFSAGHEGCLRVNFLT